MATESYQGGQATDLTGFYNGLRNDLYRQQATLQKVAQQKAKRAEDLEKELGGEISKLNPSSLRPKDIPAFYEDHFNKAKEKFAEIKQAQSESERAIKTAEFRDAISGAELFIGRSKRRSAELLQIAPKLTELGDDSKTYYQTLLNSSIKDSPDDVDFAKFNKKLDLTKGSKWEDDAFSTVLKDADKTIKGGRFGSLGGNAGQFITNVYQGSTEAIATKIMSQYEIDDNYKALKNAQFPELAGNPQAIAKATLQARADDLNKIEESFITKQREPKGDSDESSAGTVDTSRRPIPIADKNITPDAIIRISPTAVNLGGLQAYDIESDSYVTIPNVEGGVKIANVASYPFAKRGTEIRTNTRTGQRTSSLLGGKLVQSDYSSRNPDAVETKDMALVQYSERTANGRTRERNLLVPVNDLPKDKKGIQKSIKELQSLRPQNNSVSSQPARTVNNPLIKAKGR